jgi:hypothetical protein
MPLAADVDQIKIWRRQDGQGPDHRHEPVRPRRQGRLPDRRPKEAVSRIAKCGFYAFNVTITIRESDG